jgi:peptidoglycan hydrolase CwlO-like protein
MRSIDPVRVPPLRHARWALPLVLALLAGLGPTLPASGDTSSQLAKARAELNRLVSQIKGEEARASTLRGQLTAIDARIAQARAKADRIGASLATTRASLTEVRAQYQVLHDRLDQMAANEYMAGPGTGLEAILGATSFADLFDRVQFVSEISRQSADLAAQLQNVAAILAQRSQDLNTLLSRQKTIIAQVAGQQQAKATAVADEAAALQQLDQTRTRIVALVARLEKRLRAEEIASIGRTFQGGSHVSYGAWAGLFLRTMGASGCHSNMVAMVSWQVAEFTQAAWNPLATTYPMPGATFFNGSGVRNYSSLSQGLDATRLTIRAGMDRFGYGRIVSALSACDDPMSTARAINASLWCRGCAGGSYVVGMVPKVQANYTTYAAL